jgi:outer membrane protein assembly factor BamB
VPAGIAGQVREEVILTAAAGRQLRSFPAAAYGGAVRADRASVVIVGDSAVTSYDTSTGRVLWRRSTGNLAQAWLVSGQYLYVAQTSGGVLTSSPVTALRRIDLRGGAERIIRPSGAAFEGTLASVTGGVILFSGSNGLWAYSTRTGVLLWPPAAAVLELVDASRQLAYIVRGSDLLALDLRTGQTQGRRIPSVSTGLYAIRDGVGLGLDEDGLGEAWGYDMATGRVVWSSAGLPWPHFFADVTGLGGSVSSSSVVTLLTICAVRGTQVRGGSAPCQKPELAAVKY